MRVLIRQRTSSKFLADREHWVEDRHDALDFASSVLATDVAGRMNLRHVEIVLDFGKSGEDVVLNIADDSRNPPRLR
jgi:hypothetical protein